MNVRSAFVTPVPLFCLLLALLFVVAPAYAAGLSVSPTSVANDFAGNVTLTTSGLSAGQAVVVEMYLDSNANGAVDAGEPLLLSLPLTDGQSPLVAGRRVPLLPGDEDGAANGTIQSLLGFANSRLPARVAASYVFLARTPAGAVLATAPFTVTQHAYGQTVTGRVTANAAGVASAEVLLMSAPGGRHIIAGTLADGDGNYALSCPVGAYYLVAVKSGFVAATNWNRTQFAITNGQTLNNQNVTLLAADRHITGTLVDRMTGAGIPAGLIVAQPENSDLPFAVLTTTDRQGDFDLAVTASDWSLKVGSEFSGGLAMQGYVNCTGELVVSPGAGGKANLSLLAARATGLLAGVLQGNDGVLLGGISISASAPQGEASGVSDADGHYLIPVVSGVWHLIPSTDELTAAGYLHRQTPDLTVTPNQLCEQNLTPRLVTTHLRGNVIDNTTAPVAGIRVHLWGQDNAGKQYRTSARTLADGSFDLGVVGGAWQLDVNPADAAARGLFDAVNDNIVLTDGVDQAGVSYALRNATAHIYGQVVHNINVPAPSLKLSLTNHDGASFTVRTASDGSFAIPTVGGSWTMTADAGEAAKLGLLVAPVQLTVTENIDVTALSYTLSDVTAHLRGQVLDTTAAPAPYLTLWAYRKSDGATFPVHTTGDGNFDIPVAAGNWVVTADDDDAAGQELFDTFHAFTVADGADQNALGYTVQRATRHITGAVRSAGGQPRVGAIVRLAAAVGGQFYLRATRTDSTGSYRLGVIDGLWAGDAYYESPGMQSNFPTQQVTVAGTDLMVDFVPAATLQTDLMICNRGDADYLGSGVYTLAGQTKAQNTGINYAAVYQIKVQNLGNVADRFLITNIPAADGWTVKFYDDLAGSNDITAQVTNGGWYTPFLAPNASREFRVEVTPGAGITLGATKEVQVTAVSWYDATKTDTVKAVTTQAGLSTVSLTTAPASPRQVNTPITLTATPTGGGTVEYKFRAGYQDAAGWHWADIRDYSTTATFTWTPAVAHNYLLVVWAREVGHTANYDAYGSASYSIISPLTGVSMSAAPTSPRAVNTAITLTATAVGGTNVEYKFRAGYQDAVGWHWADLRGYNTTRTYTWTPTDAHLFTLAVWAREVGHTTSYDVTGTASYRITPPPLLSVGLGAVPTSPRPVNTPITLTATPTGGGTVEYKFRAGYQDAGGWHWSDLRGYGANTYLWTPSVQRLYTLVVWAREVGSTVSYQVAGTLSYRIAPQPLTSVSLAGLPPAPQPINTPITLTATPVGGSNVEVKFRAGYQDAGGWHWADLNIYSTTSTFTWTPATARLYTLAVWAREVGSTASYQVSGTLGYRITAQ